MATTRTRIAHNAKAVLVKASPWTIAPKEKDTMTEVPDSSPVDIDSPILSMAVKVLAVDTISSAPLRIPHGVKT